MAVERQASTLPPPQPVYILRGHAAQIHSVQFAHQNRRLLTGDAEGWVVFWKVETKRALVVWRAHHGAILGTAQWRCDRIITYGFPRPSTCFWEKLCFASYRMAYE